MVMTTDSAYECICAICHRFLKDPRGLDCQHSFCHDCIKVFIEQTKCELLACPLCLQEMPKPNVDNLPRSHQIENLVSVMLKDARCIECTGEPLDMCTFCNQFICEQCFAIHESRGNCNNNLTVNDHGPEAVDTDGVPPVQTVQGVHIEDSRRSRSKRKHRPWAQYITNPDLHFTNDEHWPVDGHQQARTDSLDLAASDRKSFARGRGNTWQRSSIWKRITRRAKSLTIKGSRSETSITQGGAENRKEDRIDEQLSRGRSLQSGRYGRKQGVMDDSANANQDSSPEMAIRNRYRGSLKLNENYRMKNASDMHHNANHPQSRFTRYKNGSHNENAKTVSNAHDRLTGSTDRENDSRFTATAVREDDARCTASPDEEDDKCWLDCYTCRKVMEYEYVDVRAHVNHTVKIITNREFKHRVKRNVDQLVAYTKHAQDSIQTMRSTFDKLMAKTLTSMDDVSVKLHRVHQTLSTKLSKSDLYLSKFTNIGNQSTAEPLTRDHNVRQSIHKVKFVQERSANRSQMASMFNAKVGKKLEELETIVDDWLACIQTTTAGPSGDRDGTPIHNERRNTTGKIAFANNRVFQANATTNPLFRTDGRRNNAYTETARVNVESTPSPIENRVPFVAQSGRVIIRGLDGSRKGDDELASQNETNHQISRSRVSGPRPQSVIMDRRQIQPETEPESVFLRSKTDDRELDSANRSHRMSRARSGQQEWTATQTLEAHAPGRQDRNSRAEHGQTAGDELSSQHWRMQGERNKRTVLEEQDYADYSRSV